MIAPIELRQSRVVQVTKAQVGKTLLDAPWTSRYRVAPEQPIRPRVIGVGPEIRSPVEPGCAAGAVVPVSHGAGVRVVVLNLSVLVDLGHDQSLHCKSGLVAVRLGAQAARLGAAAAVAAIRVHCIAGVDARGELG